MVSFTVLRRLAQSRRTLITLAILKGSKAGQADLDVYGWPSPNFADFDQDGDLDLICGEFLDGFGLFLKNQGSKTCSTIPHWHQINR